MNHLFGHVVMNCKHLTLTEIIPTSIDKKFEHYQTGGDELKEGGTMCEDTEKMYQLGDYRRRGEKLEAGKSNCDLHFDYFL